MRLRTIGPAGVWLTGKRWSLSYWPPRAWKPLSIREGWQGRSGWWGALRFTRQETQS